MKTILALLTLTGACFAKQFMPTKVTFEDLLAGGIATTEAIEGALTNVGLVSINEIPEFETLRKEMLAAASTCALASKNTENALSTMMGDFTARHTLGTQTLAGKREKFSGFDHSNEACAAFQEKEGKFTALFDNVISAFADHVDVMMGNNAGGRKLMLDSETNTHFESVKAIINEGMSLEHFHTYEKNTNLKGETPTSDMHVDQGLFIALTPAETEGSHGFSIQLPSGKISEPDFGNNAEIVLMLGNGFEQWISPKFRAVPHAVEMSEGNLRSWYGKMILPKPSTYLEKEQMTFEELRELMKNGDEEALAVACSNDLVINRRNLQSCNADQVYCWHQCTDASTAGCGTGEYAACLDTREASATLCPDIDNLHAICAVGCIAEYE